ncbi:MAG: hypothetical protein II453_07220 [Alphaproteobacteria bacterium]|nr:hypothetical protein [Alphaproteobacteria bacterium]
MRGYKAFNSDLTCRGMQYEVGKEYKFNGEPIPCRQGFHFCETIADCYEFYPMRDDTRICEVEATGEVIAEGVKRVTNVIKILAEITCDNLRKGNTGASNSGYSNSGNWNSGNWNSGNWNSGNWNSGYSNSGYRNSGNWNSGYSNSGYRNNGDSNSGDWNSGDWNSGDRNSGDWNSGDRNSGVFNTEKKPTIKMFDKDSTWTYDDWYDSRARRIMEGCPYSYSDYIIGSDMTDEEKENHPEYKTIGGFVKTFTATAEDKQKWWDSLSESDKNEVKALPNFDAGKFCKCVGIEHI